MKLTVLSAAVTAMIFVSCGPPAADQTVVRDKAVADSIAAATTKEMTYTIEPASSKLMWKGVMLGVKNHEGTVSFQSGSFSAKGTELRGGSFVADMSAIIPLDTNYNKDSTKDNLIGHLQSADFFDVRSFPSSALKITGVTGTTATAELTLRGVTNTETITDIVVVPGIGVAQASGRLAFDRQKYGVRYPGPGKDMVVGNEVELYVQLMGRAQ